MTALVMSIMSLARSVASRSDGWVRTHAASGVGRVRSWVSRGIPAGAAAASIVRAGRVVVARAEGPAQAGRASIVRLGRAVAARAEGPAQAGRASIVRLGRAVAARAEGPVQACAASIVRLARA